jgi:predicted GIY-YIG superfamily endonuclease
LQTTLSGGLVHLEIYATKAEALKREVALKKYSHNKIELKENPL